MPVTAVSKIERFFRAAASLDIDRNDVKRYQGFVHQKIYDLLLVGQATAKANGRDVMEPRDLPITRGLQESMHRFRRLDRESGLEDVLEALATWPPLEVALADETQARLPEVAGGLSMALAESFSVVDPNVANPQTWQWERVFRLFHLLL